MVTVLGSSLVSVKLRDFLEVVNQVKEDQEIENGSGDLMDEALATREPVSELVQADSCPLVTAVCHVEQAHLVVEQGGRRGGRRNRDRCPAIAGINVVGVSRLCNCYRLGEQPTRFAWILVT